MGYNEQFYIRKLILENATELFDGLPIINDADNIVDNAIIKQNCWQMYGSSKSANSPYKVMYKFNINCDNDDSTYRINSIPIEKTHDLINILSMKKPFYKPDMFEVDDKDAFDAYVDSITPKVKEAVEHTGVTDLDYFNKTTKIAVENLSFEIATDYTSWMAVVVAIVNEAMKCKVSENIFEKVAHSFAEKANNYNYQATQKLIDAGILNYPKRELNLGLY
ncbi:hypothetical protein T484DRAFT_1757539 [Baffinella frigidus]|nr:hypothetical protein T484DRAFT_1757539 [Cryptophyta sp. CCMP2293]